MSKKLTLAISFIDEDGKVMAFKKAFATWALTDEDGKNDCEHMRSEIASIFTSQLKIDLDKELMRSLVDELFDEIISCTKKN
jgi:hypothetical protein